MNIVFSPKADKDYSKLPIHLQKKADKQFDFLIRDYRHPSLRVRKMGSDRFEGRIDYHYRFTFVVDQERDMIMILSIGMHDEGLGKK